VLHELLTTVHAQHGPTHAAVTDNTAMVAVHAAITALTVVGLRYADRGMAALGAALGRVVPRRQVPLPVADGPLTLPVLPDPAVAARIGRLLAATHVRRGPPACC
jgi:hypothetical protein